jgi:hypothetical protein
VPAFGQSQSINIASPLLEQQYGRFRRALATPSLMQVNARFAQWRIFVA